MRKEFYEKPSVAWLKEKFNGLKLGWLKASELEVYVAYMLMYDDDLDKVAYDIAEKYGYTESKVRKLQVEFAKHFLESKESDEVFLTRIFNLMLSEDASVHIGLDIKPSSITFTIYNPVDARIFRKIINKKGVMSYSDLSMQVFHLTPKVFATMFYGCNAEFDKRLKDKLKDAGVAQKELNELFALRSEKRFEKVKNFGKFISEQVMSNAVSFVVGSFFK